jgi:hypothetical protein
MGYAFMVGNCISCKALITFNPVRVPSLTINGVKEPLCENCFNEWNRIHRTSKGLPPVPLQPDAYGSCGESELGD